MTSVIEVSGNSPVLKWLVSACQESTPWLIVSADHFQIDWDMALERWRKTTGKESVPQSLSAALKNLLPAWPLSLLRELNSSAWRHTERESLTTRTNEEPFKVHDDVRGALDVLTAALDKLLPLVDEGLGQKNRSRWGRRSLEEARPRLQAIRNLIDIRFLRRDLSIRYQLGRRLVVAKGDMTTFLKGSSSSYYYDRSNSDTHRRAESWRLARRLVRSHADCYDRLEEMLRNGVPSQATSLSESSLAESLKQLAHLEHTLARSLASEPRQRYAGRYAGFVELEQEFTSLKTLSESHHGGKETNSLGFYPGQNPKASPFGVTVALLEQVSGILKTLRSELHQKRYEVVLENVEAATKDAVGILSAANRSIVQETHEQASAQDLDEAIDWLIAESPLLSLLVSGFLSIYTGNAKGSHFGLCLSPWLVTTITARKALGTLPMTYLGIDTSSEGGDGDKDNDVDDTAGVPARGAAVSGRRLWELVQTSLA